MPVTQVPVAVHVENKARRTGAAHKFKNGSEKRIKNAKAARRYRQKILTLARNQGAQEQTAQTAQSQQMRLAGELGTLKRQFEELKQRHAKLSDVVTALQQENKVLQELITT